MVLGLAVIGGWQWWQKHQDAQRVAAGQRYEVALKAVESKDPKQAQAAVAALSGEKGGYAALAQLQLAKVQVEAGQRDAAIATLRGIRTDDPAMKVVVDSRLARLLIDAGKPADAMALIGDKPTEAAMIEARGDALLALGKRDEARAAYADALARIDVGAPKRRLVELKLTEAGGDPAAAKDKS